MTQTAQLRNLFDDNNGSVTLAQIMNTYLAASYRQRLTDLKRELIGEGKTIVCHRVLKAMVRQTPARATTGTILVCDPC